MGWQKEDIQARADRLGIDSGDSSHDLDHMQKLAEYVGMDNYNSMSNADTDELERRLKDLEQQRATQQSALDQKRANINANANNIRNAANVAMASKNPYAMGIGGAIKAADKVTGGKSSEAIGKALDKEFRRRPFGGLAQKASNKLSESGASDAIGKAASMKNGDATGNANDDKTKSNVGEAEGSAGIEIKKSGMWKWLLLASCCCVFVAFFVALISSVYELRLSSVIMGNMTAEDRELLGDVISEIGQGDGRTSEVGMGEIDMSIYYERLAALGNVFSSDFECEKEDCSDRPEVRYYLKVADIALRYKNKYNINLDWVLLNATMMYSDQDEEATMERSLHDYNLDDVENYDILMDLDWDYDYKKIPGYTYLDPDDFRYDLQILAKNMVTKTTTQTCTKTIKNEDGTYTTIITKSQTDIDIEAQYFEPGEEYYLQCDSGETYHIANDYKYDAEKYDEFLLEYIERKYYMPSNASGSVIGPNGEVIVDYAKGNSLSANMVNLALSQQGVSGRPNIYTKWLGTIGGSYAYEWCATFVSWVIAHTEYEGEKLSDIINYKTASVNYFAEYFINSPHLEYKESAAYGGNYTPKQGDIIFFAWKSNGQCTYNGLWTMDHIGIVVEVKDGKVYTIEGNTSDSVATRSYDLDSCSVSSYGVWY